MRGGEAQQPQQRTARRAPPGGATAGGGRGRGRIRRAMRRHRRRHRPAQPARPVRCAGRPPLAAAAACGRVRARQTRASAAAADRRAGGWRCPRARPARPYPSPTPFTTARVALARGARALVDVAPSGVSRVGRGGVGGGRALSLRCAGYNPAVGAPRAVPWAVVADAPPAAGYLESRVPGRPPPPPRPLLPDGTGVPAVAAATRGGGGLSRFSGRVAGVATWGPTAARDGGRRPPLCTPREARRAPICSFVSPGGLVVRICTVKYMIACHPDMATCCPRQRGQFIG